MYIEITLDSFGDYLEQTCETLFYIQLYNIEIYLNYLFHIHKLSENRSLSRMSSFSNFFLENWCYINKIYSLKNICPYKIATPESH